MPNRSGGAFCIGSVAVLCLALPAVAALSPSQVLLLVNRDQPISSQVAAMYQRLRGVPPENVLKLSLGNDRNLVPEAYWQKAAEPLKRYLGEHPAIRCILTTSGVPYTIQAPGQDAIAFDNELAAVLRNTPAESKHSQPNPLFLGGPNLYGIADPRQLQMVYVSRLDGPPLPALTQMVADAIATEQSGLRGPVYGDAQGIDGVMGYGIGDFSIRAAIDRLSGAGFKPSLDMNQASWKQPKNGVGTQAAGAAFYMGWYDLLSFQNIFGVEGLARGSIAWHLASQEAQDIWRPNGGWCAGLMAHGAAVTLGPMSEPYVTAFPHGDIFTEKLLTGDSVAESYWLSLPQISWTMVLLGDPLYRPFGLKPQPSLVARAYIAANASHVLHAGETAPLLILVECVGPEGSSTPAVIGKAVADFGLAAASGPVAIPSLKAGQTAAVRVPSVTAGADPTGMFRLRLEVQDGSLSPRTIVLEGRTGFSRLTGGLSSKTFLSASPTGDLLASGVPGFLSLIETDSLRARAIEAPKGYVPVGVEFAPDGGHFAIALYEPQQKQTFALIVNRELRLIDQLKPPSQFRRWLGADQILIEKNGQLIAHTIGSGEETTDTPPGASGFVIPGTNIAIVRQTDGAVGYKKAAEPVHFVLAGVQISGSFAVANDLSLFGGLDREKKLWIQRGPTANPEVIATGVESVLWGPVSRRVFVRASGGSARVYDGPTASWTDLGAVTAAIWSPDEERLLFVQKEGEEQYLALLDGHAITRLCDLQRIGAILKVELSARKDYAFLLSGFPGRANAWMIALPPSADTRPQ